MLPLGRLHERSPQAVQAGLGPAKRPQLLRCEEGQSNAGNDYPMPKLHTVNGLKPAFFRAMLTPVRLTEQRLAVTKRPIGQVAGTVQAVFDNPNGRREIGKGMQTKRKKRCVVKEKCVLSDISYATPRLKGYRGLGGQVSPAHRPEPSEATFPDPALDGGTPCAPRPRRLCIRQNSPAPWSCATPHRCGASWKPEH